MYNANNYGYNPYGTYIPPRQMPNVNENLTVQPVGNSYKLNGKQVESLEVAKAMDIPMDGSISYFPLANGSAIITKKLQMDGTSKLVIYKPEEENNENMPKYITKSDLDDFLEDYSMNDIEELKDEINTLKKEIKDIQKRKSKGE